MHHDAGLSTRGQEAARPRRRPRPRWLRCGAMPKRLMCAIASSTPSDHLGRNDDRGQDTRSSQSSSSAGVNYAAVERSACRRRRALRTAGGDQGVQDVPAADLGSGWPVDQQGLGGPADASDPSHLGVDHDVARHVRVCAPSVDIGVADPLKVRQHGDTTPRRKPVRIEALAAAARHDDVDRCRSWSADRPTAARSVVGTRLDRGLRAARPLRRPMPAWQSRMAPEEW